MVTAAMKLKKKKKLAPWKKSYEKPRQHVKNQRHHFADKCLYNQTMVFPVVTYGYESWVIKMTEGQRIDAFELWLEKTLFFFFFEKTLESPLDSRDIKPINPKGNQS